jgi:hypothetical protein
MFKIQLQDIIISTLTVFHTQVCTYNRTKSQCLQNDKEHPKVKLRSIFQVPSCLQRYGGHVTQKKNRGKAIHAIARSIEEYSYTKVQQSGPSGKTQKGNTKMM